MDKVKFALSPNFLFWRASAGCFSSRSNLIWLVSLSFFLSIGSSFGENSDESDSAKGQINSLASSNTESVTSSAEQTSSSAEPRVVEVEKWDFGVVTDRSGATKDWKLHPVVLIPNLAGVQYGWKIKTNSQLPIFVREEFTLPEPPSTWKLRQGGTSELKNGGEQCILESFQATDDGWIGHAWTASHGDPPGKYEIKVWVNGKLAHDFLFNVGESPQLENSSRDW